MEKIALLPGGFKPPHAGHYNMAKWLAANTDADSVVIKVGSKERDGITRDISLQLWDLYRKADEDSNKLVIVPSEQNSPVRDVYDFIEMEGKDPNELGFTKFTKLLHKATEITTSTLMKKRMALL